MQEAWRELFAEYFGSESDSDIQSILQDWYEEAEGVSIMLSERVMQLRPEWIVDSEIRVDPFGFYLLYRVVDARTSVSLTARKALSQGMRRDYLVLKLPEQLSIEALEAIAQTLIQEVSSYAT